MSQLWIIILCAVVLVALFVLSISITLMVKGHNIKSEISDNENMKALGIKCVVQEERELMGLSGDSCDRDNAICGDDGCHCCGASSLHP